MPRNTRPAIGTPSHGGAVSHPVVRNRSWWPAFTVTFLTAVYALGYLLWERSDWGSPAVRDLVGNVAFMPLNVAVLIFNALASRSPILDPRVRKALRLLAIGAGMVFVGNTISVLYLLVLHQNPTVTWADPFYLCDSLFTLAALLTFPLARRTRLERWKFGLDAAMVLVGGGVAIWYFSVRPTAAARNTGRGHRAGVAYPLASMLILLGITTVLLRRPGGRQSTGVRSPRERRAGQHHRRPDVQLRFAPGRRPQRELGRCRVPDLLHPADRQRGAVLQAAGPWGAADQGRTGSGCSR